MGLTPLLLVVVLAVLGAASSLGEHKGFVKQSPVNGQGGLGEHKSFVKQSPVNGQGGLGEHKSFVKQSPVNGQGGLGIHGGKSITIEKAPYLGAVISASSGFRCSCSIISNKNCITSGDCVYGGDPSDLTIVVGSNDGASGTTYQVNTFVIHPKYDPLGWEYDVAILEVTKAFKWSSKVKPVKLPHPSEPKPGSSVVTSGWGPTNGALQQGTMKWQKKDYCDKALADYNVVVGPTSNCVQKKGTTSCQGDWGNPFLYHNKYLCGILIGVVPDGQCQDDSLPNVCANICEKTILKWMKGIIKSEE